MTQNTDKGKQLYELALAAGIPGLIERWDEIHRDWQATWRGIAEDLLRTETRDAKYGYGCHCDLEPGMKPDGCVFDEGRSEDCVYARLLLKDGKGRNDCKEWRPIKLEGIDL